MKCFLQINFKCFDNTLVNHYSIYQYMPRVIFKSKSFNPIPMLGFSIESKNLSFDWTHEVWRYHGCRHLFQDFWAQIVKVWNVVAEEIIMLSRSSPLICAYMMNPCHSWNSNNNWQYSIDPLFVSLASASYIVITAISDSFSIILFSS